MVWMVLLCQVFLLLGNSSVPWCIWPYACYANQHVGLGPEHRLRRSQDDMGKDNADAPIVGL
jgi:hypothetical protein